MNPLTKPFPLVVALLGIAALPSCHSTVHRDPTMVVQHASRDTLTPFGSDKELEGFLSDLATARQREAVLQEEEYAQQPSAADSPAPAPPSPPPADSADDGATAAGAESVTNVQHAGVDEGGIVKVHGEHLVVLRRGRLFTVQIGDDTLRPVSAVDAFGPGIDPNGTWYDEMLLSDDTVAVIGYSYDRGGTEVGLFDIDDGGGIRHRSTYHLRSNDYYSSRNYASRLIGDKLIFYTPLYLDVRSDDLFHSFPALRKWHPGATDAEFTSIVSSSRVYRPIAASNDLALHTVTVCDLAKRDMTCEATAVFGPPGRVFYVSPESVFVWTTDWSQSGGGRPQSLLYRMPLDGSGPSALRVHGAPVDQFSFLYEDSGFLNVLVRAEAEGDGMWGAEVASGDVALLRVAVQSFSSGAESAPISAYRALPKPAGYTFQNRFVGDYLLYGTGSGWGPPEGGDGSELVAVRYAERTPPSRLRLPHGVDRIEALGRDAIVVGTDGKNLHFSPVALGAEPSLAKRYTRKEASQGELRSHGFFYKPGEDRSGLLGLPIREAGRPGFEHLFEDSASILFLENDDLSLKELGTLGARPDTASDDGCRASCVDWYGNARPLFLQKRVFALLGYEIVEGTLDDARIHERRRVSFAPILKVAR